MDPVIHYLINALLAVLLIWALLYIFTLREDRAPMRKRIGALRAEIRALHLQVSDWKASHGFAVVSIQNLIAEKRRLNADLASATISAQSATNRAIKAEQDIADLLLRHPEEADTHTAAGLPKRKPITQAQPTITGRTPTQPQPQEMPRPKGPPASLLEDNPFERGGVLEPFNKMNELEMKPLPVATEPIPVVVEHDDGFTETDMLKPKSIGFVEMPVAEGSNLNDS